ncbi:MAG: S8 family serine peptidase [Cyanobacteria bacterium]|nr:S8 family serine peptidase [Cyanobacteriota bacterium]
MASQPTSRSGKHQNPWHWQRLERLNTPSPILPLADDLEDVAGEPLAPVELPLEAESPLLPEFEAEPDGLDGADTPNLAEAELEEGAPPDLESGDGVDPTEGTDPVGEPPATDLEAELDADLDEPLVLGEDDLEDEVIEFVYAADETAEVESPVDGATDADGVDVIADTSTDLADGSSLDGEDLSLDTESGPVPETDAEGDGTDPDADELDAIATDLTDEPPVGEGDSEETEGALVDESLTDDGEEEDSIIPPLDLLDPETPFSSGIFTVGESGLVVLDVLWDGGAYEGEAGIFSLRDLEVYEPGSAEFIEEAVRRVLSDSALGHIFWDDTTEAARFDGVMGGGRDHNGGVYGGLKVFEMEAGDTFGVVMIPNSTFAYVFDNPGAEGAARPLFSMVTANPNESFQMGQIADVTGDGSVFAFEDKRLDRGSDRDYNDFIFQVRGATGEAVLMDEVIARGKDWRGTAAGQLLLSYAQQSLESPTSGTPSPGEQHQPDMSDAVSLPEPEASLIPPIPETSSNDESLSDLVGEITPKSEWSFPDHIPTYTEIQFEFTSESQPVIGIISTGFSGQNPDINFENIIWGKDYIDDDSDPTSMFGETRQQGTHTLGIIAAQPDNGIGINGINPAAPIYVTRAMGSEAWTEALIDAVDHIKVSGQTNGIISLNFDLSQENPDGTTTVRRELTTRERASVRYAQENGVILVTGVSSDGAVTSALGQALQEFDNIITVAALESVDRLTVSFDLDAFLSGYNNPGDGPMVVASGGTSQNPVLSTMGDGLGVMSGSSVAAARVTGVVSQIWAANPALSYRQVMDILQETATDLGTSGWDLQTGAGLVNLVAAVNLAKATQPKSGLPLPSESYNGIQGPLKLPPSVEISLRRAENLDLYDPVDLASARQWVVNIKTGEKAEEIARLFNARLMGRTRYIEGTYVFEFPDSLTPQEVQETLQASGKFGFVYPLIPQQQQSRFIPNDPLFLQQWHLRNQGQNGGRIGEDSNLTGAWSQGVTGQRVVIGIVDDGLQHTHPDLAQNYRSDLSRDFNEALPGGWGTYDHDPQPNSGMDGHGTAVAGVAAARGNNNIGGTGAAPNAQLAGLRLTASASTDMMEADALSYLNNSIHIYNNSWGPLDDGRTKKAPNPLTAMALHLGATTGRNGLGNIYVWAGGNGKEAGDNVNYDGYANSRYTIAVAAIDENGKQSHYSEPGAALLISAHSSGSNSGILTTDILGSSGYSGSDYTDSFGGTSSSAPLVSGIIALMLEANPSLTWRDVQKILIDTARKNDPEDSGWRLNGGGYWVNHKYGFGAVDASAAVALAKSWQPLGTEVALTSGLTAINAEIPDNDGRNRFSSVGFTEDITVETVEVVVNIQHFRRGDLDIRLVSPEGTVSVLAERHGDMGDHYDNWVFSSTRHWGESSKGQWRLQVTDRRTGEVGFWDSWQLNLYGSKPTVNISATIPKTAEGEGNGEFTVTRTGSTSHPLSINYEFRDGIHWSAPAATSGKDFVGLPGQITIPAGSSSIKVPIVPIDDDEPEWTETVNLRLTSANGYEVGSASMATVSIFDNELPRIQLLTEWEAGGPATVERPWHTANYISEAGNTGRYMFRRLGDVRSNMVVNYTMSGTATSGVDYEYLPGSITIRAGDFDRSIIIKAIDDDEIEGEETAILTIDPSLTYNVLPGWGSHPTVIWDNDDKPSVSIAAITPTISEYGEIGKFRFTRTGDTSQPLTVHFWEREWWLRAIPGKDYEHIPGTVTTGTANHIDGSVVIPAGDSSVDIDIIPIDDNEVEPTELVRLLLRSSPDYAIVGDGVGIMNILDNDTPKVDWQRQLGTSGYDYSEAVTLDSSGNIYIAGRTSGNLSEINLGSYDAWVAKYNSSGSELWRRQLGTSGYDAANGVVTDKDGNLYVAGWTDGSIDGGGAVRSSWLAKYGSDGALIWHKTVRGRPDTVGNLSDYGISNGSLAIDSNGSLYLTGVTHGSLESTHKGDGDAWIARYDDNGNQQWVRQIGTPQRDEARGVAVDSSGFVYITGYTRGNLDGLSQGDSDAWIAKYDPQGLLIWKRQLGTQAEDVSNGISIDVNGNVYIAGYTRSLIGDPFIGNPHELGDSRLRWAAAHRDQSELGGVYHGNADAWVAQYDSNGNLKWKRQIGTSQYDAASAVASDRFGNVYITGQTQGKVGASRSGGDDVWVAKYNVNGAIQWVQQLGTSNNDLANGIVVSGTGLYITGHTSGSLSGMNQGGDDAWLIRMA